MPFADYEDFDACVRDNQDVDDPEAYCAEIKREVEGEQSLSDAERQALEASDCPEGHASVNGECVPVEEVENVPPSRLSNGAVFRLRSLDTAPIEREEVGNGKVAYRNLRLLDTGVWTDSASRKPTLYGERGMQNLDPEWDHSEYDGPPVNIMHDANFETGEVNEVAVAGYIDPDSLTTESGALYGDVVLDTTESAGEFADENLQTALESGGAVGFGGPSVELDIDPRTHLEDTDHPKAEAELTGGRLTGMALVMDPASKSSNFARQTAEKGVALADGQSDKAPYMERVGMSDATVDAEQMLGAFDVERDDLDLADGVELADVPVSELVALIAESYGADPAEIMEALDPFIDGEESEMQEDEEEDEENDGEDTDDEEEEDEEGDDVDINMEERLASLDERLSALEDQMDSLVASEELEELADADDVAELEAAIEELEDAKSDLEERTRELEEEPQQSRTFAEGAAENGEDGDVDGPISAIEPSKRY